MLFASFPEEGERSADRYRILWKEEQEKSEALHRCLPEY